MSLIIPKEVAPKSDLFVNVSINGKIFEGKILREFIIAFLGMSYSGNTESYSNGLQGRTAASSPYSSYGATATSSHLQPKDMVSRKL